MNDDSDTLYWVHATIGNTYAYFTAGPTDQVVLERGDWNRPPRIEEKKAGRLGDILWCEGAYAMPVSERMINVLVTNRVTGWKLLPLEVCRANGEEVRGYSALIAAADPDGRHSIWRPYGAASPTSYAFITTGKVAEAVKAGGVTGVIVEVTSFDGESWA